MSLILTEDKLQFDGFDAGGAYDIEPFLKFKY